MTAQSPDRRAVLVGLAGAGAAHLLPQSASSAAASGGYVLGAAEGEHLVHFRDHGDVFIKIAPSTGSNNVALGTQQVMAGTGVPDSSALPHGRGILRLRRQRYIHSQRRRSPLRQGCNDLHPEKLLARLLESRS